MMLLNIFLNFYESIVFNLIKFLSFISKFDAIIAVLIGSYIAVKNFRFQSMHKKRLEMIEQAYEKIKIASLSFRSLTNPMQLVEELDQKEKMRIFAKDANEMIGFLEKKRLFFNKSEQENIDKIVKKFFSTWGEFSYKEMIKDDVILIKDRTSLWKKIWDSADVEIPELIRLLENEFKKTLSLK